VKQWFHHARLSNESKPALMLILCSPYAPEEFARETVWEYSQGAPPVFKGDLHYYAFEYDLKQTAKDIDTRECALYGSAESMIGRRIQQRRRH
jgi:hypothetical protein